MSNLGIKLIELGVIPESILRVAIKKLIQKRLLEEPLGSLLLCFSVVSE